MNKIHYSSKTDLWSTPQDFFDKLDREFNFNLDPCANRKNAKCNHFYSLRDNGLSRSWKGQRVFCNPPYGRGIGAWIKKCAEGGAKVCVGLFPARTDTKWFHTWIYNKAEIRFVAGRLRFGGHKNDAPFPCMVVIWKR